MTIEELYRLLMGNDVPGSAILNIDTGLRCAVTDMVEVYYCIETNEVVVTPCFYKHEYFDESPDWVRLEFKKEESE